MSYEVWGDNDDDRFEAARDEGWLDPNDLSQALIDVMTERDRQHNEEGWTPEHDDSHDRGELARAAVCYADPLNTERETPPAKWPWDASWWKPDDRRRDLVKAGALILAEIERLDRAALSPTPTGGAVFNGELPWCDLCDGDGCVATDEKDQDGHSIEIACPVCSTPTGGENG